MLILCACPEKNSARKLARIMLEERLAACVQLLPQVESLYRWQGQIEQAEETLLLMKTTKARWPALRDRLAELHPYEVPEIVALDIADGLPAYLKWVADETGGDAP